MTEGDLVSNENNELYMSNNYIYFTTRNKCGSSFTNFFIIDLNLNGYAAFSQKGIALNKYSFSEYDGYFRYVLTDFNAQIYNSIYVYDLENKKLEGSLENQIGLEGERVKSVRFKDNKCYICTYRNTDPLYVIDLSDYKDIKILKELHVPGYSDYLHYFEINGIAYVLGVGRNEESFSKITIYKEENDDLIQVGKSFILAFSNTENYITFDEYYYEFKDLNNNYYGYNSASINNNVIGYFFYNDSNYLYFGSPIANQHYAMFKIDVNNLNEPISVYYEYKTNKNTYYYIGIDYLRCFLINNKFYYFGDGSIIIEEL